MEPKTKLGTKSLMNEARKLRRELEAVHAALIVSGRPYVPPLKAHAKRIMTERGAAVAALRAWVRGDGTKGRQLIQRLEKRDRLMLEPKNTAAWIARFAGWLMARKETVKFGSSEDCAPIGDLLEQYRVEKGLPEAEWGQTEAEGRLDAGEGV